MTIDQLTYWCLLIFLLWILVDVVKQLSKELIKRDKMPKAAKELLSNFEPTFKVGEYYVSENKQIYKLTADQRGVKGVWRRGLLMDDLIVVSYVTDKELQQDKPAAAEQIATFKRAEQFAKHGRKLDEFRVGDITTLGVVSKVGGDWVSTRKVNGSTLCAKGSIDLIQTAEELQEVADYAN